MWQTIHNLLLFLDVVNNFDEFVKRRFHH